MNKADVYEYAKRLEVTVNALTEKLERQEKRADAAMKHVNESNRTELFYKKLSKQAEQKALVWEGKFHQVKRENNKLRKRLYQQEAKDD